MITIVPDQWIDDRAANHALPGSKRIPWTVKLLLDHKSFASVAMHKHLRLNSQSY